MIRLFTATFCRLGAVGPHCGLVRHTQRDREREREPGIVISRQYGNSSGSEMYALPVPKTYCHQRSFSLLCPPFGIRFWGSFVEASWNVMAHAQKPDFVFRWNGRVHLNRRGRQFSRLLEAEVCASAVVMLDTPCSEVVWRVLATHSIRQFPLHFPSRASPCAVTFQLESTTCVSVRSGLGRTDNTLAGYFPFLCSFINKTLLSCANAIWSSLSMTSFTTVLVCSSIRDVRRNNLSQILE